MNPLWLIVPLAIAACAWAWYWPQFTHRRTINRWPSLEAFSEDLKTRTEWPDCDVIRCELDDPCEAMRCVDLFSGTINKWRDDGEELTLTGWRMMPLFNGSWEASYKFTPTHVAEMQEAQRLGLLRAD